MSWDPDKYNEFKLFRYKPFYDLVSHISNKPFETKIIDLGCGTGGLTHLLSEKNPNSIVLGIDSSKEMLDQAEKYSTAKIKFVQRTVEEQIKTNEKWDLIFANASIQWVENHKKRIPQLISLLNAGGQLAIQMPAQNQNILNQIVFTLVQQEPYNEALKEWKRTSPVLSLDEYTQILFQNGGQEITLYEKVYPLLVQTPNELYELIAGSTLVPYFERLDGDIKEQFVRDLKKRIGERFINMPALYAFKRIIMHASF